MESLLSLLARLSKGDAGPLRPPADGDDAPVLLTISRALQLMRLPANLAHFQGQDACAANGGERRDEPVHPDAASVLQACRERHGHWTSVSIKGLWHVYRSVLKVRCLSAIERFLSEEPLETRKRVCSAIRALRPKGAEDDPFLVWVNTVWHDPGNANYAFARGQIRAAWTEVQRYRERIDSQGAVPVSAASPRIRKRAVHELGIELELSSEVLADLPVAAYDSETGILELILPNSPRRRARVQLGPSCRKRLTAWIAARGPRPGTLFCELSNGCDPHQVPFDGPEFLAYTWRIRWLPARRQRMPGWSRRSASLGISTSVPTCITAC